MNLNIKDFLDFATYHGMLDGITITEYPAIITELSKEYLCGLYHIEVEGTNTILWTHQGWIHESHRRWDIENTLRKPIQTKGVSEKLERFSKENLSLKEAIASGDETAMLKALMKKKGMIS